MENGREIPKDLMIEILVRLPLKSIFRFKCVSKTLCNMLNSPNFIQRHLRNERRKNVLLVRRCLLPPQHNADILSFHDPDSPELEDEIYPNLSIPNPFLKDIRYHYSDIDIIGSSIGLVCIFLQDSNSVILCNPSLREFKYLPPCPRKIITRIGFGNTSTNDFKVVVIDKPEHKSPQPIYILYVYSSSTKSWKKIDADSENDPVYSCSHTRLFFNGSCHWHALRGPYFKSSIFSFNLNTEVTGWMEYPDIPTIQSVQFSCFLVIEECFAVGLQDDKDDIDIWVMKKYGIKESWTKLFAVSHLAGPYLCPFISWRNEWVLVQDTKPKNDFDRLVFGSFYTKEFKEYEIRGQTRTLIALIYQESLISLEQF